MIDQKETTQSLTMALQNAVYLDHENMDDSPDAHLYDSKLLERCPWSGKIQVSKTSKRKRGYGDNNHTNWTKSPKPLSYRVKTIVIPFCLIALVIGGCFATGIL